MIVWKSVFSSNANEIGYDDENETLYVKWARGGKTSAYQGVPASLALEVSNAPSVGSALNDLIKPVYPHRYV